MKRDRMYRAWCYRCKSVVRWQESSGRTVDKLLCPGCGFMVDAVRRTSVELKGELVAEARTFVERTKRGR